ncbi:MAG: SPOR domain-containing protein [Gammaproteobacteria bacterium]
MASFMKQRLIGAIVLISLGIIFIPMLLTGRGNVTTGESASNVPPKPTYEIKAPAVLPLEEQDDQGPAMAPVHDDEGQAEEQATMASTQSVDQGAAAGEQQDDDQRKQTGGTDTSDKGANADIATASSTPQQTQTSASAEKSSPPVSGAKASGTKAGDAKAGDTKDQSTKAVTAKTTTTTKAQQPEKTASSKPATTTKKPVPVEETTKATTKPVVSGWVVQLGSFSVEKNALILRDKLRSNGHASFVERYKHDGKTSYRVRVGPEQTRELAEQLKSRLKKETQLNGLVMSFPK